MTDVTLPEIAAGVAVTSGDLWITRQGADTEDKKVMTTQLATYMQNNLTIPSALSDLTASTEDVQDIAGAMVSGNTESLITVTYQDADGTIDFVVDNDLSNYDNSTSSFITSAGAPVQTVAGKTGTVTLATADIASGTFANARIAESNVTQHEAALTVTESQISDLGSYITASSTDTLSNKTITAPVISDPVLERSLTTEASTSFTIGQIGFVDSSGTVTAADASAESTGNKMLVMAQGTVGTGAAADFTIQGFLTTTGLTQGATYYLSETAKGITATAPTTASSVVRVVGYALSTTVFYFNPDGTWVTN